MSAFVGTCTVASAEELRSLIQQLESENCCFFLKWPHKVSGFCKQLPQDFPSPEGQMFDRQQELRWKRQGKGYSILLLSTNGEHPSFKRIGRTWTVREHEAYLHPKTETRFPKGINSQQVSVGQRYFCDPQTATVHFVALRVS